MAELLALFLAAFAALERLRRYGSRVTFSAWLPIVGDALAIAAIA
jgi:membrane protein YqaA with SNARE-associated domain